MILGHGRRDSKLGTQARIFTMGVGCGAVTTIANARSRQQSRLQEFIAQLKNLIGGLSLQQVEVLS